MISKGLFGILKFSQKPRERIRHCTKNKFVCSFFGENPRIPKVLSKLSDNLDRTVYLADLRMKVHSFANNFEPVIVILLRQFLLFSCVQNQKINIAGALWLHCNPLQGKYRSFTGLWQSTGFEGSNFIEIEGNICIMYRDIALDIYMFMFL